MPLLPRAVVNQLTWLCLQPWVLWCTSQQAPDACTSCLINTQHLSLHPVPCCTSLPLSAALARRYSHIERSVFLFEPKERTWGIPNADQIQLAPEQTYAAALLHRPPNYWLNRLLRPISSTVSV